MIGSVDAGAVAEHDRQCDERGDHDRVQDEDAGMEPPHLPVAQRDRQPRERGAAGVRHARRVRDPEVEQGDGDRGQDRGRPEQPGDARDPRQGGTEDEGERERGPDAPADARHRLGPMRLPGEIAGQRHHRRRHRAQTLQRASGDDPPDAVRERRDHAAEREDHEPGGDGRLTSEPVGEDPERHLEDPLGQSVDADRDADEQRRMPRVLVGVHAEDGQEHELPEHAQGEDARERGDGTALGPRHCGGRGLGGMLQCHSFVRRTAPETRLRRPRPGRRGAGEPEPQGHPARSYPAIVVSGTPGRFTLLHERGRSLDDADARLHRHSVSVLPGQVPREACAPGAARFW